MKILLKQIFRESPVKLSQIDAPCGKCVFIEQYDGRTTKEEIFDYLNDSIKIAIPNKATINFYNNVGYYAVFSKEGDDFKPLGIFYPLSLFGKSDSFEWKKTDELMEKLTEKINKIKSV